MVNNKHFLPQSDTKSTKQSNLTPTLALVMAGYSDERLGFIQSTRFERNFHSVDTCYKCFSDKTSPDISLVRNIHPCQIHTLLQAQALYKSASIHCNVVRRGGGGMAIIWYIWYLILAENFQLFLDHFLFIVSWRSNQHWVSFVVITIDFSTTPVFYIKPKGLDYVQLFFPTKSRTVRCWSHFNSYKSSRNVETSEFVRADTFHLTTVFCC